MGAKLHVIGANAASCQLPADTCLSLEAHGSLAAQLSCLTGRAAAGSRDAWAKANIPKPGSSRAGM